MTDSAGYSCICQTPDCGRLFVVTTRVMQARQQFCSTACGRRGRKLLRAERAATQAATVASPPLSPAAVDPVWIGSLV